MTALPEAPGADRQNLLLRLLTVAVLAPVAIGIAYAGGLLWALVAILVAFGLFLEWLSLVGAKRNSVSGIISLFVLVTAALCVTLEKFALSLAVVLLGTIAVMLGNSKLRRWAAAGMAYAGGALIAAVWLRHDPQYGFAAALFVLLIVWATDSGGYFAGRAIGGPKLWPRVSPKKTWAGALSGSLAALAVAAGFVAAGYGPAVPLLLLAFVLSIASQLGDLFESAVKRRFGVKDSGRLIPGHGGLLDRLDGFVAAIIIAATIGVLRGGSDGAARGLMLW